MNRGLLALVVLGVAALILSTTFIYTIDEREQVVITRFGRPIRTVTDPGLHFKTPFVDVVNTFEKRILPWDGKPDQVPTADKKYIFVDTYARWRIVDPLRFFQSVTNERGAQIRLSDIIDGSTRDVISKNPLFEVVRNTNRELPADEESSGIDVEIGEVKSGRHTIGAQIFAKAKATLKDSFGIELMDVQIEKINYVGEVREKVYERMISERKRIAELFRSEGQRTLQEITGLREKELKRIESEAYYKAQLIRGGADAEAAAIYAKAFGQDPEFFRLTRSLQTYRETLTGDSTILLSTDTEYLKYLKRSSGR